jgi:sodium-coupled neutral amino acid transporter 11
MFPLTTKTDRGRPADTEHAQPLLSSQDDDRTIFSVDDSDDESNQATALDSAKTDRTGHSVRFEEQVQIRVFGPPLRSTLSSREAGVCVSDSLCILSSTRDQLFIHTIVLEFDLDSDEMDEQDNLPTPPGHMDQSMPLLVGLFESSASRRSIDEGDAHEMRGEGDYNLEEIAAKRMAGGSVIDSIANMANSILGAGP